jgi:hypothetical protein
VTLNNTTMPSKTATTPETPRKLTLRKGPRKAPVITRKRKTTVNAESIVLPHSPCESPCESSSESTMEIPTPPKQTPMPPTVDSMVDAQKVEMQDSIRKHIMEMMGKPIKVYPQHAYRSTKKHELHMMTAPCFICTQAIERLDSACAAMFRDHVVFMHLACRENCERMRIMYIFEKKPNVPFNIVEKSMPKPNPYL